MRFYCILYKPCSVPLLEAGEARPSGEENRVSSLGEDLTFQQSWFNHFGKGGVLTLRHAKEMGGIIRCSARYWAFPFQNPQPQSRNLRAEVIQGHIGLPVCFSKLFRKAYLYLFLSLFLNHAFLCSLVSLSSMHNSLNFLILSLKLPSFPNGSHASLSNMAFPFSLPFSSGKQLRFYYWPTLWFFF